MRCSRGEFARSTGFADDFRASPNRALDYPLMDRH
jgi:hypothetical protein